MKYTIIILSILLTNVASAQLSLEHSYTETHVLQIVNIEGEGNKYLTVDTTTKNVMLHNEDHSLWKRINTSMPTGARYAGVSCVSKKLINLDNNIELAYSYYTLGISGASPTYTTQIYSESGSIIQTLTDAYSCYPVKVNGNWKIIAYGWPGYTINVYSVPGEYLGITKPNSGSAGDATATLYPNPMDATATIEYSLPAGIHSATLNIYDMQGKSVREYQVTDQFTNILINKESLPAGMYQYQISTQNQNLLNEKFLIK